MSSAVRAERIAPDALPSAQGLHVVNGARAADRSRRDADALAIEAMAAADEGRLHAARALFERSVLFDSSDAARWRALGLCSLALGDVGAADDAWSAACALGHDADAESWLASLRGGPLKRAVEAYAMAEGLAAERRWDEVLLHLNDVLEELPQFVPAGRLRGLALDATGNQREARIIWREHWEYCRDDQTLSRLLEESGGVTVGPLTRRQWVAFAPALVVAVVLAAVLLPGRAPVRAFSTASAGEVATDVGGPATMRTDLDAIGGTGGAASSDLARAIGIILGNDSEGTLALLRSVGAQREAWSAIARARANSLERAAGARFLQRARNELDAGRWEEAVRQLEWAVEYGHGADYEEEALSLLTRIYDDHGMDEPARRTAVRLVNTYPTSVRADSRIRHLAGKFDATPR